ncbi:putative PHO88-involved in phosphate transport [Ceraceosorus guamensis]|uniref:Putative PHO88-involved in phosphate transport n=1 Tax=Ceraceosorus guamensis TaxID=1522189 RepID=A0A316VU73_9BASI|nr:putative PHO88-involved in phosphate transport [Ceraceosorus guamensis]PWN41176.1 putative PHO88-involved in phosphate transport [Ceraceosorus guamensis]
MSSAAVMNLAFMFGAMQVAKRIPFDDKPEYIQYARAAYVAAQLFCVLINYFISLRVKKANDLTVLKYVDPKSPMSQEPGELVTTTHREYDLSECSKATRGVLMGTIMVGFMHLYMGYTNPLVIQSILPIKNALESKEARIWLWGQPATGELKRPFKAPPGMFGMAAPGPATDKAAITAAEKAGGKKDE